MTTKKPKEYKVRFVQGSLGQIIMQFPGTQTPQTTLTYAQVKELGLLGNKDVIYDHSAFEAYNKSKYFLGDDALLRRFAKIRDKDFPDDIKVGS